MPRVMPYRKCKKSARKARIERSPVDLSAIIVAKILSYLGKSDDHVMIQQYVKQEFPFFVMRAMKRGTCLACFLPIQRNTFITPHGDVKVPFLSERLQAWSPDGYYSGNIPLNTFTSRSAIYNGTITYAPTTHMWVHAACR